MSMLPSPLKSAAVTERGYSPVEYDKGDDGDGVRGDNDGGGGEENFGGSNWKGGNGGERFDDDGGFGGG